MPIFASALHKTDDAGVCGAPKHPLLNFAVAISLASAIALQENSFPHSQPIALGTLLR